MSARAWAIRRFRGLAAVGRRTRERLITAALRRAYGDADIRDSLAKAARLPLLGSAAGRALADRLEKDGALERALELRQAHGGRRDRARLEQQARLLRDGMALSPRSARRFEPEPRRVVYCAAQALPFHSTGYCIRTHGLVRAVRAKGWDVSVHTRLGYPIDRWDFLDRDVATEVAIDGVPYVMTPDRAHGIGALDPDAYQAAAADALVRRAEVMRPAIIHAASNWQVGLAAVDAARRLGLPSIYEVRGLWHQTVAAQKPAYLDSDHYRMVEKLEVSAALGADHVFAITGAVRDILVGHGVPAAKISILPNAVDPGDFAPAPRDEDLARQIGLTGKTAIGYIGSLKDFEGLDLLLHAAASLSDDLCILLVGDGPAERELRDLADRAGLRDRIIFTGRVPHDRVRAYYSLMEIMAFPRKRLRVCETVSPLKPFEAMAMGKPIVVSDVAALTEIVRHGETGLVHRADDAAALAAAITTLAADPALRHRLGAAARAAVSAGHSWSHIADQIEPVYRSLGEGRP